MVDSSAIEHRAVPRVAGDTIGPLQLRAEPDVPFEALVRDVSIQGIGLIAQKAFASGTSLVIEAGPWGKSSPELAATVRHATTLADGRCLLGCVFSRLLTIDDFAVLG